MENNKAKKAIKDGEGFLGADIADNIVSEIITKAGLSDLPKADMDYLRENLSLQVSRRLGLIIIENLSEEGQGAYIKLIEGGLVPDVDKMQGLLEKYLPDYQDKIKAGLDIFIQEAVKSFSK
ncbi:MAG: hypothetical protein WC146_01335 [Patescibacteria group bacterium]|jgi:hypothetical protein